MPRSNPVVWPNRWLKGTVSRNANSTWTPGSTTRSSLRSWSRLRSSRWAGSSFRTSRLSSRTRRLCSRSGDESSGFSAVVRSTGRYYPEMPLNAQCRERLVLGLVHPDRAVEPGDLEQPSHLRVRTADPKAALLPGPTRGDPLACFHEDAQSRGVHERAIAEVHEDLSVPGDDRTQQWIAQLGRCGLIELAGDAEGPNPSLELAHLHLELRGHVTR